VLLHEIGIEAPTITAITKLPFVAGITTAVSVVPSATAVVVFIIAATIANEFFRPALLPAFALVILVEGSVLGV